MLRLVFFLLVSWVTNLIVYFLDNLSDTSTQLLDLHCLLNYFLIVQLDFERLFENLLRHLIIINHSLQLLVLRYFFFTLLPKQGHVNIF